MQVPQSRVHTTNRPAQIAAGEFVLTITNIVGHPVNVGAVHTERPGRNLTVQDLRGDVGAIGSGLPPALGSILRRHTHEADEFTGEGFD